MQHCPSPLWHGLFADRNGHLHLYFLPWSAIPALWLKILSRIVLIPIVAGIAYEFLKFSATHQDNPIMKILIAPGLALQGMTTREPDLDMLEVSIAALEKLLAEEKLANDAEAGRCCSCR